MRRAAAVVLVVCGALFAAATCKRSGPDWRILQLYAGERSADLLAHPASVRSFELDPSPRRDGHGDLHAGPFAGKGDARDVAPGDAAALAAILSDAESYDWQRGPKRTPFRPTRGLWFVRGSYVLELALDLESAQLGVYAGGQTLGVQSIDPAAGRLADIMNGASRGDAPAVK